MAAFARLDRGVGIALSLTLALHLALEAFGALAQSLKSASLRADRLAASIVAVLKIALGLAHRSFGVLEALLALEAEALHPPLQVIEAIAERLLPLVQRGLIVRRRAGVRALVARILPATAGALILAERVVAQLLLIAEQAIEVAELAAHFALRLAAAAPRAPQVFVHILPLLEPRLGFGLVAAASAVLTAVEHALQIFFIERRCVGILVLALRILRFFREFAGEILGRRSQFLHQFANLIIARAALQRLAEPLLGGAKIALGLRGVAILDLQGHRPKQIRNADEIGVRARLLEAGLRRIEPEVHARTDAKELRRDEQGVERGRDAAAVVIGIKVQVAALLDQGLGERIAESPLRQRHFDGLARSFFAGDIGRAQRHHHFGAGPGVLGKIARRLGFAGSRDARRQLQSHAGRLDQRASGGRLAVAWRLGEIGFRGCNSILVGGAVAKGQ